CQHARLELLRVLERDLRVRLGREKQPRRERAEPLAAQADLLQRLLAADIEDGPPELREAVERREEQRALADARIAREQHHRARNETPAERAIQFPDARLVAPAGLERDLIDGNDRPQRLGARFEIDRAECAAAAAFSEPLDGAESALATYVLEDGFHGHPQYEGG